MKTQKRTIGPVTVLDLHGRLDAHQSKVIDQLLIAHIEPGCQTVVNLQQVHFIDSTGLSILVKAVKHHREQNGELVLCAVQQPVQIIFELTRLDRVFAIYPTEAAALQALQLPTTVVA